MAVLFWLYWCAFLALTVFGVADDEAVSIAILDSATSLLILAGMLLYWTRREFPRVRRSWKIVFGFLVVSDVYINGKGVVRDFKEDRILTVVAVVLLVLFVLPAFWMNWRYATGRSMRRRDPVPDTPPAVVDVWSPLTVAVFAFVFAFPSALMVAVRNWLALRRRDRIWPHVIAGVVLVLVIVPLLFLSRKAGRLLALGVNIAAFAYLRERFKSDLDDFRAAHPESEVRIRPWYTAAGWAVCGLLLFMLIALPIGMMME